MKNEFKKISQYESLKIDDQTKWKCSGPNGYVFYNRDNDVQWNQPIDPLGGGDDTLLFDSQAHDNLTDFLNAVWRQVARRERRHSIIKKARRREININASKIDVEVLISRDEIEDMLAGMRCECEDGFESLALDAYKTEIKDHYARLGYKSVDVDLRSDKSELKLSLRGNDIDVTDWESDDHDNVLNCAYAEACEAFVS